MKLRLMSLFVLAAVAACAQSDGTAGDPPAQAPQQQPVQNEASPQTTQQSEAHRSAIDVKPGQEVIKSKDLWDATGYFHPFVRMPKYVLQDQKAIWTSPFHTAKKDIKYWAIFGVATVGLIASDKSTVKWLPNSSTQVNVSNWGSRLGSAYTLVPLTAGFYFIGTAVHDDHFRETGL